MLDVMSLRPSAILKGFLITDAAMLLCLSDWNLSRFPVQKCRLHMVQPIMYITTSFLTPFVWHNRCINKHPGYHFGTMVLGSLVVGIAQPFRISMGALAGVVRLESNSTGILNCFCSWIGDVYATWTRTRTRSFDIFQSTNLGHTWTYMF